MKFNYFLFAGLKKFVCPNLGCGRSYKYKMNLNRHLHYECGKEKQFECELCLKCFAQKENLRRHCVILHGVIL